MTNSIHLEMLKMLKNYLDFSMKGKRSNFFFFFFFFPLSRFILGYFFASHVRLILPRIDFIPIRTPKVDDVFLTFSSLLP